MCTLLLTHKSSPSQASFVQTTENPHPWKRHSPPMSLNPKSLNLFSTSAEEEEEIS